MRLIKVNFHSLVLSGLLLFMASAQAAPPPVQGTYVLNSGATGTFAYTPLRAIIQYGSEGKYVINGKGYPGSMYRIRGTSDVGMVWYYGVSGLTAGNSVISPITCPTDLQPPATACYSGPITFTDRKGNPTDTGMVTVGFK